MSSRNGSIIGWTSYNYPDAVTTATESATFDYGPDRQRWRMVYTGPSGTETTYYATPLFEVVHTSTGTDYRHYIFAGGKAVMQLSRSINGALQRPLLTDHQGSISTIMHGTGTSFVNESFTVYGNRREASTWTGTPTSTELANMNSITRQGYTFQTVLGSMGLNHMNGRIEDSVTGRFLSPDPRGTIRGNTQSWNRYSYVLNNPVTLTDPTGHNPFKRCSDFCPSGSGKLNFDPGSLTSMSAAMSSIADGMQGNDGTYAWVDAVTSSEYATPSGNATVEPAGRGYGGNECGDCAAPSGSNRFNDPNAFNPDTGVGPASPPPSGSAQSQTSSSDGLQEVVVTAQSTAQNGSQFAQGPLLAQEASFIDPFLEAIRTRPVSPAEFGKTPQYTPRVGVPEPLPEPPPQNFWYQLFNLFKSAGSYIDNILGIAPPVCPTCVPA